MKKLIFLWVWLFLVIPCQAKTITVEAAEPVSVTIEADDFNDSTDISTAFNDITLSNNGTGPVYAVISTKANGLLGTHVIGSSTSSETWGTLRVDFNGFARLVRIRVVLSSDYSGSTRVDMRAYNSAGTEIDWASAWAYPPPYPSRSVEVKHSYFDIAYVTVEPSTSSQICLDRLDIELLPVYQGPADYDKIQDAIDNADDGDIIEVLPGTYYERINFYGLSATVRSTDPENVNIVSITIIDGLGSGNAITFDSLEDSTSILAGFTIQDADTGIYCYYSDPLISNCVIKSNITGIDCDFAAPTIVDTVVRQNSGAGIIACQGEISNCTVADNSGNGLLDCGGLIQDCKITRNSGGVYGCQGEIAECVINGNLSNGIANSNANVTNCTIVGNKGHGVRGTAQSLINNIIIKNWNYGVDNVGSDVLAYNNIWGNLDGSYSNVTPCPTDIHKEPHFAIDGYWDADDNWVEGKYHLKSAAGRWTESGWVYDDVNSPCIDAGDPCEPIGSEPNPNGGRINMGAYGGTAEASKSPSGIVETVCTDFPAMDFNKDCKVDFEDFALFTQSWLDCNLDPPEACWE